MASEFALDFRASPNFHGGTKPVPPRRPPIAARYVLTPCGVRVQVAQDESSTPSRAHSERGFTDGGALTTTSSFPSRQPEAEKARRVLSLVAAKWTVPIVRCLVPESRRPSELMDQLAGISQKVLTQTLRRLERSGLVDRRVHATVPPRVDYRLTPLGRSLIGPLDVLNRWVEQHGAHLPAPGVRRGGRDPGDAGTRRKKPKPKS